MILQLLALIGLVLSIYFLYVDYEVSKNKNYKALCDFSSKLSCSKAVKSKHSRLVLLPNAVWGVVYYSMVIVLATIKMNGLVFLISIPIIIFTAYLSYVLYVEMKDYCVVCTATHLINLLILVTSFLLL